MFGLIKIQKRSDFLWFRMLVLLPNKILKLFRNRLFGGNENIFYFSAVFMN